MKTKFSVIFIRFGIVGYNFFFFFFFVVVVGQVLPNIRSYHIVTIALGVDLNDLPRIMRSVKEWNS